MPTVSSIGTLRDSVDTSLVDASKRPSSITISQAIDGLVLPGSHFEAVLREVFQTLASQEEDALHLRTLSIETQGKGIAADIEGVCKKIKLVDALYMNALELSEKDGSLYLKKNNLSSSIETIRKEGFILPVKEEDLTQEKKALTRDERDSLLRSLTQQRDDLSTQAIQLNMELNRYYTMRDDHFRYVSGLFRYVSGLLGTMNDTYKKLFRNIG